ncbi:MAG TPA: class I SAM-dependent methyltransferase [Methanoregula sp.]|nr:class I SAM-dependent methyltransferase [Methanoregula sp.]
MADTREVQEHYDSHLARNYAWIAGGWEAGFERSCRFISDHAIRPTGTGVAVDLGAGCSFYSVALAEAGYRVTAIDFSAAMLEFLKYHAGDLPIRPVHADIRTFVAWEKEQPELIICMGDTLTHLPDYVSARNLIRRCARELTTGGTLVLSCRNYSKKPAGSTEVIPVRRDEDRIFLCRIDYGIEQVRVTDILYTRESGSWERMSGTYSKLPVAPDPLRQMLSDAGFRIRFNEAGNDTITLIGQKKAADDPPG